MRRALATIPLFLAVAAPLAAQDPAEEEPDRWKTVLDIAFTSTQGNERLTLLSSEVKLTHLLQDAYSFELMLRGRYGRSEGEEVAKNYRLSLDFAKGRANRLSPFLFTSAEHDPFRRLDLRANGGAGARFRFYEADGGEASVSGALLYSYEDRSGVSLNSAVAQFERDGRWSWRIQGQQEVGEGMRLEHTTFYQPIWNEGDDYLLEVTSKARALIGSRMAVTFTHSFERDSTPLPEVEKNDSLFKVGVTFEI